MDSADLERRLFAPRLEGLWQELARGWAGATAAERAELLGYLHGLRTEILEVVRGTGGGSERAEVALCYVYVRTRCVWTMLHNQANFESVLHGRVRPAVRIRAAAVGHLLAEVEPLLAEESLASLGLLLGRPVGPAAP